MKSLGQYILAGSLFICWAILLATWYIVPAILMTGHNYSNPEQAYANFGNRFYWLGIWAWFLFIIALFFAIPLSSWKSMFGLPAFDSPSEETEKSGK